MFQIEVRKLFAMTKAFRQTKSALAEASSTQIEVCKRCALFEGNLQIPLTTGSQHMAILKLRSKEVKVVKCLTK